MAVGSKDLAPENLRGNRTTSAWSTSCASQGGAVQPPVPVGHRAAESHGRLRAVRRDIARIYTIMRERGARITSGPQQ